MSTFQNPTDGISQEALAGLVAEAVQQALVQHGIALDTQALAAAGAIAGSVAAAQTFLSQTQRLAIDTVRGEWAALATEFVQSMADKAARRGTAPRTVAAAGGIAVIKGPAPAADPDKPASPPPGERMLQSMLIEDWAGEVAGSTYLEEKFRIPRSTLHRWQRRSEVIALRKGGRKHVFPLAQFVDGRPATGYKRGAVGDRQSEACLVLADPRLAGTWRPRPDRDAQAGHGAGRCAGRARVFAGLTSPPRLGPPSRIWRLENLSRISRFHKTVILCHHGRTILYILIYFRLLCVVCAICAILSVGIT